MSPTGTLSGLPAPSSGPTPPTESPDRRDPLTRKPMSTWDRSKFLIGLAVVWVVLFWSMVIDNPIMPVADAFNKAIEDRWWLLLLILVEGLRQLHYVISEHSAAYHQFWTTKVFGAIEARTFRLNDWTRYRMARVLKWLALLAVVSIILGAANKQSPFLALFELPSTIWAAMPFVLQMVFSMMFLILQFAALFWFMSRGGVETYFPDDIKTRFTDVWGQDAVVARVKENMLFLEDPESIEAKGGYVPGGLLLWGPPGTGKTLMAEAVAGETGRPYVFVDPGAFEGMFIGVGILKVKALFRKLRKLAVRYGGVIVFFDEADSLGNRRQGKDGGPFGDRQGFGGSPFSSTHAGCNGMSYLSHDSASLLFRRSLTSDGSSDPEVRRRLRDRIVMGGGGMGGAGQLQALLSELSGLKKPRGFINRVVRRTLGMRPKPPPKYRIMVMMATNLPQALDEALLRPGRIDRIYKVGYPSKAGRIRTYEGYFAKVSHCLTPAEVDKLATITPYATGATIKDLVNEALIYSIRMGRQTITWEDVIKAKQLKDLGPPEDVEYIERERHAVAVHEACHAVTAFRVRRHLTIDIATIEKGGNYLGMVASIPPEDQFTQWRTEYEADVMVSLASLAGERLFFAGDNSSGVSGDLESATQIATLMEGYWGMGSTVTSHGVTQKVGIGGGGRPGKGDGKGPKNEADLLHGGLGERIEEKLEELLQRAEDLLKANRIAVLAVAHALETHKTVTGDDIEAIIEARPGPLIDGRVYGDPEFARVVEEYHAQAITAHQGHSGFEISLPKLNGQRNQGGYDTVDVRPDGTYAGPSPWSRPGGSSVAQPPPIPPPVPLPPVWPPPVAETSAHPGPAVENGPVENGPVENGPVENGPVAETGPMVENGPVENGTVEMGSPIEGGPIEGGPVDSNGRADDGGATGGAGSEAKGRPADD